MVGAKHRGNVKVRKNPLIGKQMTASEYVERAAWISRELTRFRARGPGDIENAMRGIERDYGVDYWFLWRLRYRLSAIRDIGASVYARLVAAYRNECERQHAKLVHEIAITRELVGPDHETVVAAAAVVGEVEDEETG
jgi:hypothetical protein